MLETLLTMDILVLVTFTGASLLLILTPGADMMFAIASGMSGGPKAGIAAAAGISVGAFFHSAMAAIGLAALIFKSIYGGFAGAMATRVRRHAKLMNKISATVFGGLAARLALS